MTSEGRAARAAEAAEPLRVETRGAAAQLHLEGIVGIQQAKRLHQLALKLASAGRPVSVRCEHVQHIDGAGVQVLLALHETLRAKGVALDVQNLPESVQQTLRTAGLASAL